MSRKKDLCVLWELDPHSYLRLQELSRAVAGSRFLCASFHPHITLGCYEQIEDRQLRPWVRAFAGRIAPFAVRFEEVGLLTSDQSACFPAYTGGLRQHYAAFHERFDEYADRWTSVAGGLYTPHVSLYDGPGAVDDQAKVSLQKAFAPFEGRAVALSLSWVRGEDDYQILARYALGGAG